jgi:tetratricopeptide (TPR) repeat protein
MRSMTQRPLYILLLLVLALAGCGRDPETAKRKYVENGDRFYKEGKYRQASIMYRNAIKRDPKFGEAYAKLGDSELRRGDLRQSIGAFRRAVELLPENEESAGKLADIYLAAYAFQKVKNPALLNEVRDLVEILLQKDKNSYHAFRLQGFLHVADNRYKEAYESFLRADRIRPKQPELRFAMAQVLREDGQWEESERIAREITTDSPQYPQAYEYLAREYVLRKRNDDAVTVMRALVNSHPLSTRFRIRLAALHFFLGQRDEAIKLLDELLAREGEFTGARLGVGTTYLTFRDYERAMKVLADGVAKNDANKSKYRLNRALGYVAQGRFDEAAREVDTTLKDDPQNIDALSLRASLQLQTGDREKSASAIADLQALIGRDPRNVVVRYNLARAHHSRGELDAARVQYAEAVRLRSDFVAALIGLGQVNLLKRDFGAAIEAADSALSFEANNIPAKVLKSNALLQNRNLKQARLELEGYLRQAPDSPDLQFQMALVNFHEQRFAEAEATFRALSARYPNDPRLIWGVAEVYMRTKRGREALQFLQEEMKKYPDNPRMQYAVASIALRTGEFGLAESLYRQLLMLQPKNLDIHLRLGETLRQAGQLQPAIEIMRKAVQLEPNNPGANLQLAMTLDAAGLQRESLPLYETIVKVQPDNPIALNNLAYMLAEDGRDLDQALTYAQRARQQRPNDPDIADTLGWIYIRKNLSDNAIRIFRELTAKHDKNPIYHYHLGMALYQKGDRGGARQSLQQALTLRPSKNYEDKIRELLGKVG